MRQTVEVGQVFGKLTVVRRDGSYGKSAMWLCQCNCGNPNLKRVASGNLRDGTTKSCGCLAASNKNRPRKHSMCNTRVYRIWQAMKKRCLNRSDPYYFAYGAKGITVCDSWLADFRNFYADMGEPPSDLHTLDRKQSTGNYEPGNCKWSTPTEQANNRSTNRHITVGDVTATISQWAALKGIPKSTIRERLQRGWSPSDAVNGKSRNTREE